MTSARIRGRVKAQHSGSIGSKIVMGQPRIINVSWYRFGLEGSRGVKPGMELALFLELPEGEGPLRPL